MKNGIEKRGASYSYAIRVPDSRTGKTKLKKVGGFATEKEAKVERAKALVSLSKDQYVEPSRMTLEEFLLLWFQSNPPAKALTRESYQKMIRNYLNPHLGKIPVTRLKPTDIQRMNLELKTKGGKSGTGLSDRTVKYANAILSSALKYGVEVEGILSSNVATRVRLKKGESQRFDLFTKEEMSRFLEGVADHRLYALYYLAHSSGARLGELLALRWSDLVWEEMSLSISKNRVQVTGEVIEQNSTKGGDGRRVIYLDPKTVEILRAHRRQQVEEKLLAGSEWNEGGFIFTNQFGKPIGNGTPSHLFQSIRKGLGLPPQRFHDLRHFHATTQLEAGVPLHVVSARLGHRDAMVTATIYAHVTDQQARTAGLIFAKAME